MAMQRLLALDLDGTLLRSDLTVSQTNQAAVAACLHKGVHVVLASGRVAASVVPYARQWKGRSLWILSCNGAEIRPADGGPPLLQRLIPLPLARSIAGWAETEGLYLKTYVNDVLLVGKANEETLRFSQAHRIPYQAVGDVAGYLTKEPTKMVLIGEPERLAAIAPCIRARWGAELEVATSEPHSLELTARGVTKGSALQFLAQRLRVEPSGVAAIGNAQNDLSMITWAGFGGAVQNAPPEVHQAASLVVSHHNNDGVAEFITAWHAYMKVTK